MRNTTGATCGVGSASLPEHQRSPQVFGGVRVAQSLVFYVVSFVLLIVCLSVSFLVMALSVYFRFSIYEFDCSSGIFCPSFKWWRRISLIICTVLSYLPRLYFVVYWEIINIKLFFLHNIVVLVKLCRNIIYSNIHLDKIWRMPVFFISLEEYCLMRMEELHVRSIFSILMCIKILMSSY